MIPFLIPLIGTAVKGVFDYFGSRTQGKAAEKAAEQQQAAAREAQALFTPYVQQGAQGLTALSALMGIPQAPAAAPAAGPAQAPVPFAQLTGTARGNFVADANRRQFGAGFSTQPTGIGGAPAMVRLRAPTGEEREVPADQVNQYLARGAVRI